MRKPRLQLVLAWIMIGTATAWILYAWAFVIEGHRYFRHDWSRVLVLLSIVAAGTPILLGYNALSAERQRRVALWLVGILAVSATGFTFRIVYSFVRLAGFLREAGTFWMWLIGMSFLFIIAAYLWWAFARLWQRKSI